MGSEPAQSDIGLLTLTILCAQRGSQPDELNHQQQRTVRSLPPPWCSWILLHKLTVQARISAAARTSKVRVRSPYFVAALSLTEPLPCRNVALRNDLKASISSGKAFVPTPELLASIDEDLDALSAISQMGRSQERVATDVLSVRLLIQ